jgi:urease accessory protein
MAVVYVQTPAGGLIQGDRAAMQFTLESNARVHVTTQAAEKIHTMTANCAVQQVRFTLASHSYAEYCPEPIILFPQSRFAQDLQVELGESAWFFFTEIFLVPASMELFTAFANRLTVREASRKVLLHERGCVFPAQRGLDGPGILADHRVWGQGVFSGPQISSTQTKDLALLLTDQSDVTCGVTSLPYERGVAVKVVATNVPAVRQTLHAAWNFLRLQWLRAPAPQFPK